VTLNFFVNAGQLPFAPEAETEKVCISMVRRTIYCQSWGNENVNCGAVRFRLGFLGSEALGNAKCLVSVTLTAFQWPKGPAYLSTGPGIDKPEVIPH